MSYGEGGVGGRGVVAQDSLRVKRTFKKGIYYFSPHLNLICEGHAQKKVQK